MVDWITLPSLTDYKIATKIMEDKLSDIIDGKSSDTIYLVEHNDVYTAGTSYDQTELLDPQGIEVIYSDRGGKFTYHGPGQRVIYPVINLAHYEKDLKLYIRNLESWIISSLGHFGIKAITFPGKVGIWAHNKFGSLAKIGAIGVRVRKWVAYHGIAVNIKTNLAKYGGIIPCGIHDFPVTSMEELGVNIDLVEFDSILKQEFGKIFTQKVI